jgi:hypothetical protein
MKKDEALKLKIGDILVFRELKRLMADQESGIISCSWASPLMDNMSTNRNVILITKDILDNIERTDNYVGRFTDENSKDWSISLDMLESAEDLNVPLGKKLNTYR